MIYLGIDFGTRRIGLAKAESEMRMATPLRTIENDETLQDTLRTVIEEENIDEIVTGVPVSFDGKEYEMASRARAFGEGLKSFGLPVHLQNEMLSSAQAERAEAGDVDASSAALILQSFLDRRNI
jgi:putative Holliday junction resolvase